jgi:hypothetical protein
MITSKKITLERLKEIKRIPVTYDEDSPKLTPEQLARMNLRTASAKNLPRSRKK